MKDESPHSVTCQSTVVVNAPLTAGIADAKVLPKGVEANTVYVGYAPASSLTLMAAVSGGSGPYTYKWSTGATTEFIKVNPVITTNYTVTIMDAKGCIATTSRQVKVVDVRCGNKMDKVTVCHNGSALCISSGDVTDHLAHGDNLGGCIANSNIMMTATDKKAILAEEKNALQSLQVKVSPNPSRTYFTLHITAPVGNKVTLNIVDELGRIVERRHITAGTLQVGHNYRPGIYFAEVTHGQQRVTLKLVKGSS